MQKALLSCNGRVRHFVPITPFHLARLFETVTYLITVIILDGCSEYTAQVLREIYISYYINIYCILFIQEIILNNIKIIQIFVLTEYCMLIYLGISIQYTQRIYLRNLSTICIVYTLYSVYLTVGYNAICLFLQK